jgi:hypothetical protein
VNTDERSLKDKAQNNRELKKRLKGLCSPTWLARTKRSGSSVRSVVSNKEIEGGLADVIVSYHKTRDGVQ